MSEVNAVSTKVVTGPNTRFSYLHVFEPKSINGDKPRYSVCLLVPKSDEATVGKIRGAILAAYKDGASKLRGTGKMVPPLEAIKNPLRDGDVERPDDPEYAGCWFINANSVQAPGIVDRECNRILDPEEIYSGCYGRASITFFAFNSNGNRGIACGLNNLQKVRDGERLGGRKSPEEDFAAFRNDNEDFLQ